MNSLDSVAILAKAFAHPTRLQILDILARDESCVCHLTTILGQRQAHVSQHLRVLRDAELVTDRRDGLMVYYRLADARAAVIVSLLKDLKQQAEPGLVFLHIPKTPVPDCPCPRCNATGGGCS